MVLGQTRAAESEAWLCLPQGPSRAFPCGVGPCASCCCPGRASPTGGPPSIWQSWQRWAWSPQKVLHKAFVTESSCSLMWVQVSLLQQSQACSASDPAPCSLNCKPHKGREGGGCSLHGTPWPTAGILGMSDSSEKKHTLCPALASQGPPNTSHSSSCSFLLCDYRRALGVLLFH